MDIATIEEIFSKHRNTKCFARVYRADKYTRADLESIASVNTIIVYDDALLTSPIETSYPSRVFHASEVNDLELSQFYVPSTIITLSELNREQSLLSNRDVQYTAEQIPTMLSNDIYARIKGYSVGQVIRFERGNDELYYRVVRDPK